MPYSLGVLYNPAQSKVTKRDVWASALLAAKDVYTWLALLRGGDVKKAGVTSNAHGDLLQGHNRWMKTLGHTLKLILHHVVHRSAKEAGECSRASPQAFACRSPQHCSGRVVQSGSSAASATTRHRESGQHMLYERNSSGLKSDRI